MNLLSQDKGHKAEFSGFVKLVAEGGEPLIRFDEIENVMLASFAALESAEGAGKITI